VKTGAGVTGLAADDRGALEPALYCYHCEFCLRGLHNVCANLDTDVQMYFHVFSPRSLTV